MTFNKFKRFNRIIYSLLLLTLLIICLNASIFEGLARGQYRYQRVRGFSKQDLIHADESIQYEFDNNLIFQISSDSLINLNIAYENQIQNREIHLIIENNNNPFNLEIDNKQQFKNYGQSQQPNEPKKDNNQYQNFYDTIYRIRSNTTVNKLTFRFSKDEQYGLNPDKSYTLAIYKTGDDSWQIVDTIEFTNQSSSEIFLETSLENINAESEYYLTLYEVIAPSYEWIWIIVISAIVFLSVIIAISKRDYFHYLRTRQTPVHTGAHRLNLDEVLENENRNTIIEIILNEPGIHFNELLRKTELAAGNLLWHLEILETYKIIGKKVIGKCVAYFPYYQKNPISNVELKLNKSKLMLEVLDIIENNPGIWNSVITKKLKVDHKTIHYHINKLVELDLVNIRKEGRKKKLYPNLESEYFNNR